MALGNGQIQAFHPIAEAHSLRCCAEPRGHERVEGAPQPVDRQAAAGLQADGVPESLQPRLAGSHQGVADALAGGGFGDHQSEAGVLQHHAHLAGADAGRDCRGAKPQHRRCGGRLAGEGELQGWDGCAAAGGQVQQAEAVAAGAAIAGHGLQRQVATRQQLLQGGEQLLALDLAAQAAEGQGAAAPVAQAQHGAVGPCTAGQLQAELLHRQRFEQRHALAGQVAPEAHDQAAGAAGDGFHIDLAVADPRQGLQAAAHLIGQGAALQPCHRHHRGGALPEAQGQQIGAAGQGEGLHRGAARAELQQLQAGRWGWRWCHGHRHGRHGLPQGAAEEAQAEGAAGVAAHVHLPSCRREAGAAARGLG